MSLTEGEVMNQTHHLGSVIKPGLAYTPENLAVLEFTLGIRETGERSRTAYITAKVFGSFAETFEPHLKEGRVVETLGMLHQVSYKPKGKDTERTDTTITVKELLMLQGDVELWRDRKNQALLVNGVNEIRVSGHLTKNAVTHQTKTGEMTKARVGAKDNEGTLFIEVTYWNALEVKKGEGVSVTGRLLSDSYPGKDKKKVSTTYLEATRLTAFAKLT
jgi:single-strand DNA-binding protein